MNEESIFAVALAKQAGPERQAFLNEACGGNAVLRSSVEELLQADSNAGSFLKNTPAGLDATIATDAASSGPNSGEWASSLSFLVPSGKPDRIGKLVGKVGEYEIIEVVGTGGMGAVLRPFDTKLSRVVAVKVMAPELAANPTAVKRFLREATNAAAVHHDHVVTIHAIDDSHRPPYLVMQFVEGQTLQQKIERVGALQLEQILRIGSQTAAGLAAAHKQGLIHRDVKPANILLENGVERVKITDFGLARAADDMEMTKIGMIAGTPQYMSPEQAKGEPIDARSDLFSLGSVLYTMCTGRPAFRAETTMGVLRRVCEDAPRPIREVNREIPEWLCEIVDKLLAKDPQDRFQSATDVAELLAQHLAHVQQPASCPMPPRVVYMAAAAPATPSEIIKGEARWLWAAGIMSVVAAGFVIPGLQQILSGSPSPAVIALLISGLISLPVGLIIMYAAWQVESRQSYRWAVTAACSALLPVNPFLIFCLPITIWSLVTLLQTRAAQPASEPKPRKPSPGHLIIEHPVLGVVAIVMLLVSVSAATFMLTAAAYRAGVKRDPLTQQAEVVIRATKGGLSSWERLRLSVESPGIAAQLGDPATKAIMEFFADLPDAMRRELMEQGYVKGPIATLPPEGKNALAVFESTLKSEPAGSHRNAAALKQAHTGFAIVNLPHKNERVISWFLLWPKEKHEWVTVVHIKALDNQPAYFAAHNDRLNQLRSLPDSAPQSGTAGAMAGSPSSAAAELGAWQPPENPYPQTILSEAQADARAGRHELALAKHVWIHENVKHDSTQNVTRLLMALTAWKKLGDAYPPALAKLKTIRDETLANVEAGREVLDSFQDLAAINRVLGEEHITKDVFVALDPKTRRGTSWLFRIARPALIRTKEYKLCLDYIDANASFEEMFDEFQRSRQPKKAGVQNAQQAESSFLRRASALVALLAVSGRKEEAQKFADEAKSKWTSLPFHQALDAALEGTVPDPEFEVIFFPAMLSDNRPISPAKRSSSASPKTTTDSAQATPPIATAPFDDKAAKAHQETWAKHLGVPIEITNSLGMSFRLIPPGKGATRPSGIAQAAEPFFLGTTEVTVGQFRRFVDETSYQTTIENNQLGGVKVQSAKGSDRRPEYVWKHPDFAPSDDHPVTLVTWQDVAAFCNWLSKKENCTYRLPTSDEWNWAARAGSTASFYFGDNVSDLDSHAWHLGNSQIHTHPVREKLPNPWGLFDIYGNLWELSYDWERGGKSIDLAEIKPEGPPPSERITYWGGSFNGPSESMTRVAWGPSPIPYSHVGFRVAIVGDLKSKALTATRGATTD